MEINDKINGEKLYLFNFYFIIFFLLKFDWGYLVCMYVCIYIYIYIYIYFTPAGLRHIVQMKLIWYWQKMQIRESLLSGWTLTLRPSQVPCSHTLLFIFHTLWEFFSMDRLIWSKVPVKTFIILLNIYITNKCCSFEPSICQRIKISHGFHINIKKHNCFQNW